MSWAWLAVALLVGLALYCLIWRPAASLGLLLTAFGTDQLATAVFPELARQSWMVNVAIGSLVAIAWLRLLVGNRGPFGAPPYSVQALLSVYVFYFFFSMLGWSGHEADPRAIGQQLLYLTVCLVLAPALIRSHADLSAALHVGFFSAMVITVTVLANPEWRASESRLSLAIDPVYSDATGTNPLALADVGVIAAVCALFLRPPIRMWAWLRWVAVAVGLWTALQASRGEPVAAVAAVLIVLLWAGSGREWVRRLGVSAGVVLLLVGLSVPLRQTPVVTRWERPVLEQSVEDRVGLPQELLGIFYERPEAWLTGLGGNYSFVDPRVGFYPHIHVVQALCETGLIGCGLWLAAATLTLLRIFRLARDPPSQAPGAVRALLVLTVYAFLLTFKRGHVVDTSFFLLAVCTERLMALSSARRGGPRPEEAAPSARPGRAGALQRRWHDRR